MVFLAMMEWAQFFFCIGCLALATVMNWRAHLWRHRYFTLRNNPVVLELERQLREKENS